MNREVIITRLRPDPPDHRDVRRPGRSRRSRTSSCPGVTPDGAAGGREDATSEGDLRTSVLLFAHLAQVALTLSSLPARRRAEVQRDLAVLRTECDRGRMRPALVAVVVDSVLEVTTPALPAGVVRSLTEARPA